MAVAPSRKVSVRLTAPSEETPRGTQRPRGPGPSMELHAAVRSGDLAQARTLLEDGGADPGGRGPGGVTPLMLCALHDGEARALACARMLLQAGARVGDSEPAGGWDAIMLAATLGRGRLLRLLLAAGEGGEVARRERSARMTALHLAVWADRPREAAALAAAMRRQRLEPGEARDARGRSAAALARELGRGACESAVGRPGEGAETTRGDPGGAEERGDRTKGRDDGGTPGDPRGDRDDLMAGPGGREEGVRRKALGDDAIGLENRYDAKVELGKSTVQPRQLEAIHSEARLGGGSVEAEALARPTEMPAEPCGVATGSQRPARLLSGRWTIPRTDGRGQGPAEAAWRSPGQQLGVVLVQEMALGARRRGATGPACPQSFPTFAMRRIPAWLSTCGAKEVQHTHIQRKYTDGCFYSRELARGGDAHAAPPGVSTAALGAPVGEVGAPARGPRTHLRLRPEDALVPLGAWRTPGSRGGDRRGDRRRRRDHGRRREANGGGGGGGGGGMERRHAEGSGAGDDLLLVVPHVQRGRLGGAASIGTEGVGPARHSAAHGAGAERDGVERDGVRSEGTALLLEGQPGRPLRVLGAAVLALVPQRGRGARADAAAATGAPDEGRLGRVRRRGQQRRRGQRSPEGGGRPGTGGGRSGRLREPSPARRCRGRSSERRAARAAGFDTPKGDAIKEYRWVLFCKYDAFECTDAIWTHGLNTDPSLDTDPQPQH
ncbi:uncharacterized protein LOC133350559 isoform X6 [Lethenteron reissneri]|nr:uncharacterized protein LOC133350559 isoform X6 [Lethenteron reissneri]